MFRFSSSVVLFAYLFAIIGHPVSGLPADVSGRESSGQLPATTAACTTVSGSTESCGISIGNPDVTLVATPNGQSTWTESFIPTTLSAYSTLTKPTTITTTDTSGETIAAVVFAGGAALLAVPKPVVPQAPITTLPTPSLPSTQPTSSTTSSAARTPQPEMISLPDPDWMKIFGTPHVTYDSNDIACGWTDDTPSAGRDIISSKIKSFCTSRNGSVVTQKANAQESYSVGSGVALNITVDQNLSCAKQSDIESTIFSDDCNYFLHEALDGCDTNTLSKRGGTVSDSCFVWNLQPRHNTGELTCGVPVKDGTGVNRDEALEYIQDFCSNFDTSSVNPSKKFDKTYKTRTGNSIMLFSAQYSEETECKEDTSSPYIIDRASCERLMQRTIDDCDVDFKGSMGKYGGNVADGCGVFSLTTEVVEIVECGHNGYPRGEDLTPDAIKAGIDSFCSRSMTLDPNYKPDNEFHQDTPSGQSYDNVVSGDVVVRINTQFSDQQQKDCVASRAFDTKGDECRRRMEVLGTQCGKNGGILSSNTQDGCVLWSMWGTSSG